MTRAHSSGIRNRDEDYGGWTSEHVCVTAAAVRLTSAYPGILPRVRVENARRFLNRRQQLSGAWRAYWWIGEYWATAVIAAMPHWDDSAARARKWLLDRQKPDGGWPISEPEGRPSSLATALALRAASRASDASVAADHAIDWLIRHQLNDGSWASGEPILRIPAPDVVDPDGVLEWRIDGQGVGSSCRDDERVYTTAAAAGALAVRLGFGR